MAGLKAIRSTREEDASQRLYDRIGAFLGQQRLEPTPANYAFAYHLLADPEGPMARAVATLTDGGVRLTQRDIDSLGCNLRPDTGSTTEKEKKVEGLVAQTQLQVEGFAELVRSMHVETQDFGRNLAASADAIARTQSSDSSAAIDDLAHLTAAMIKRVHVAEARLDSATREAHDLRKRLEEASENALRDPLTNLANRRALEAAFRKEAKEGREMCVAICDVDHFKSVNDRFGHAVGDRVLKAIAEVLSESCSGHLVARYGGEEFAVLFYGLTLDAASDKLDVARANVAAKRYRLRESDTALGEITFSAGLTTADPDEMLATALHRADVLLYKAKNRGRNCVEAK